jgi:hypothetical protein
VPRSLNAPCRPVTPAVSRVNETIRSRNQCDYFYCWVFFVPLRTFHTYSDVVIVGKGLLNSDLCFALTAVSAILHANIYCERKLRFYGHIRSKILTSKCQALGEEVITAYMHFYVLDLRRAGYLNRVQHDL